MIGLYLISNIMNGKFYVGQSLNTDNRIIRHRYLLNRGKHYNAYLQNSYTKHGSINFKFETIITVDPKGLSKDEIQYVLNKKEVEAIIKYNSFNNGYNLTTGGEGFVVSESTRKKLSESHKGIKPSALCVQKTIERFKDVPKSEKTKERMSLASLGKKKKYSVWNKGKYGYTVKPASDSRKEKIGQAQIGIKNHNYGKSTPETVKQKCRDSYHGEQCHLAKLNDNSVREIKNELSNGTTGASLARKHGVSVSVISRIKLGEIWKHLQ